MVRGEVLRLRSSRTTVGHGQRGTRYGVVVQADELLGFSTVLVAPTSSSALPSVFRPQISIRGETTFVMVEHTAAVDGRRLDQSVGRLDAHELGAVDAALKLVLGLR